LQKLGRYKIIPARNENVPVRKIFGRYRRMMKRKYSKLLYHQRNKKENFISVIKILFGEHIKSRLIGMQNREWIFDALHIMSTEW